MPLSGPIHYTSTRLVLSINFLPRGKSSVLHKCQRCLRREKDKKKEKSVKGKKNRRHHSPGCRADSHVRIDIESV